MLINKEAFSYIIHDILKLLNLTQRHKLQILISALWADFNRQHESCIIKPKGMSYIHYQHETKSLALALALALALRNVTHSFRFESPHSKRTMT